MLECLKNLYFHSGIFEGKDRNFPLNGTEGMGGGVTLYVYVHDQVKGGGGECHRHKCLPIQMWV